MERKLLFVLMLFLFGVLLVNVGNVRAAAGDFSLSADDLSVIGGVVAFMVAFMVLFAVVAIFVYVYTSLAWMKIAKRTRTERAWMAWIPIANLYLKTRIARMHWWPLLFLAGFILAFVPYVGVYIALVMFCMLFVYNLIWNWKAFKAVRRSGWWVLTVLIPGFGIIVYLVLLGVAAWGGQQGAMQPLWRAPVYGDVK